MVNLVIKRVFEPFFETTLLFESEISGEDFDSFFDTCNSQKTLLLVSLD